MDIVNNNSKSELKDIISKSSLADEEKKIWHDFIEKLPGKEIIYIQQAIEDNSKNLDFITKNLKDKLQAIRNKDGATWSKTVKEEKSYLSKYK